ncbi:MAG: VWA domain-containing protein [Microscillaceae bacterium]|nr:VWA domain-containing protein [Microscillaceae bacterium]MDW8459765.1 VWA domain-containing protein [Cytophagales bacterium]
MFLNFFLLLKNNGIPVSLREHLSLLEALQKRVIDYSIDEFYALCKVCFIKHEKFLDRFDVLFGQFFRGMERISIEQFFQIPQEWLLHNLQERLFTEEEKALIEAMGGLDKLLERFEQLLREQKERHEGGNTWIGTKGTSPFGTQGYNPEGFSIGQKERGQGRAVKVWDRRNYKNLDDQVELNTRNIKMALKRLRILTREGNDLELDLPQTIKKTSENAGYLDLKLVPKKHNNVKILLLFDVGGSMDAFVRLCSELFSAAKHEFKHLEYYYFHNCLYEMVWKDNQRRHTDKISTWELLHKYNRDYKLIFVGDATMATYEITHKNGSVEHYNEEPGAVWLERMRNHFTHYVWLNPTAVEYWEYTPSIRIVREIMQNRMFPLTLAGISQAMKALKDTKLTFEQK